MELVRSVLPRRLLSLLPFLILAATAARAGPGGAPGLVINEVIPRNESQGPLDISGRFRDMVKLYNASDEPITLWSGAAL
jgi:hypothetical protein